MLIAKIKRRENIAEYILYMWQIEDLLRALDFNADAVYRTLVEPLEVDNNKKQEVFFWYTGIISLLKEEGKELAGHNRHSLQFIAQLNELHLELKARDDKYNSLYAAARNDMELFREKSSKPGASDMEIAFDALYAKLLLRMRKESISPETSAAFDRIAAMLARLSAIFREEER
jgi:hypothetical protein